MEHASEDGTVSTTLVLSGTLDVRRTAEVRAEVYALLEPDHRRRGRRHQPASSRSTSPC